MALSRFDEQFPTSWAIDATGTMLTGGQPLLPNVNQSQRVDHILCSSTDTVDHILGLWLNSYNSNFALIGSVILPALSGTDGVLPRIDLINELGLIDEGIAVDPLSTVTIVDQTAMTSGKHVYVVVLGGTL